MSQMNKFYKIKCVENFPEKSHSFIIFFNFVFFCFKIYPCRNYLQQG